MKSRFIFSLCSIIFLLSSFTTGESNLGSYEIDESRIHFYELNPVKQELRFYWKNKEGVTIGSLTKLKTHVTKENRSLLFAMNGGMYNMDLSPHGLYIEKGKVLKKKNTIRNAHGNFYLQPNGVFFLRNNRTAGIERSIRFRDYSDIEYATQSGPLLLIDSSYHPVLKKGSKNLHIRNGVGIMPSGNILFAISKKPINFYDFATFFRQKGCRNALYLDGAVSRCYTPSKGRHQLGGQFGVMIAETIASE